MAQNALKSGSRGVLRLVLRTLYYQNVTPNTNSYSLRVNVIGAYLRIIVWKNIYLNKYICIMRNSFKILFYIKKRQPLKSGNCPILCRITINGMSCVFSTNLSTKLTKWSDKRKCVIGRSEESNRINQLLDDIRFSVYESYMKLRRSMDFVTPQAVRNNYLGRNDDSDSLINLFKHHDHEFGQMVGVSRSKSTLYKYRCVRTHIQNYITEQFHTSDIKLNRVDINFIRGFHRWLINTAKCSTNTTWLYMIAFKHILSVAVGNGRLASNPFCGYRLRSEQPHRNFLVKAEIKRLINVPMKSPTEQLVRDAFMFSCMTGLSYSDVKALKSTDIIGDGRDMYIAAHRIKTHTSINIPLLQAATELIKGYYQPRSEEVLFPLPSNFWCNNILQRLMKRASISKHITFHSARHTFATTITLSHGVPIEVVSSMLGHTNIKTTQTYAKVLQCIVNSEMNRASKSFNSYFRL